MKFRRIIIIVLVLFFLLGATVYIPNGFVNEWGVKSVYAQSLMGPRPRPHPWPHPKPKPQPVSEPSSLILLGIGLAAVGGYAALRFWKNKNEE
jgi:hypothetical protein